MAVAGCLLLVSSPVLAGGGEGRWQVDLRAGRAISGVDEPYRSDYVPTLPGHAEAGGEAGQDLTLHGEGGAAFAVAVGYALTPRLGLQAVAGRHRAPLAVASGPHRVTLHYQSRQPPDYQPRDREVSYETPFPGGDGVLRQTYLALNLATRVPAGSRVSLGLSGGPVVHRLDGAFDVLGYEAFREGGHAVLFPELHWVRARIEPAWGAGFNLGADAAIRIAPRWSLLLDARWFHLPGVDAALGVDRVVNAGELVQPLSPDEVAARLFPGPARLAASFVALTAGVRLHF